MAYVPTAALEVVAWGRTVGAVALDPDTGWYAFQYTPEWVAGGVELAPLHMALRTEPYEFPDLSRTTFYGLPPMLADALPDAFGNALVDAWMAERGIAASNITPLDRLAYAADRAIGALEFRPPAREATPDPPTTVALADLVVAARQTVEGTFAGDEASKAALRQLISVGTSAGGARAKAVVAFNPTTSQVRSAYSSPAPGFEQWLIKLDGVSTTGMDEHGDGLGDSAPYGRIEYAYSLMAKAAGVTMQECRLLAEGPRRHFMTKRFDRGPDGECYHLISLCALAHLDFNLIGVHSYDQYLQSASALGLDAETRTQAYRRMIFNVMAVNCDDHTKNLAFLRRPGGSWELSPAYDVNHSYRADSQWTSRHLMAVNGRFEDITLADLRVVGERNDLPGYQAAIKDVRQAVDDWESFASIAEVDPSSVETIRADIDRFRPT